MYPPEVFVQMANASWDINESAEKRYKVLGDIETMLKMDEYFGTKKSIPHVKPKTNMNILLLQWIALWVLLPINKVWAGIAGIVNGAIYSVVFQMVSGKGRKRLN